ncbi:hypothetical protein Tco_0953053 [Tanacetum coccineum]|uniref:Uncharacterized protein n=1 Tax=Tanacetum coccineum TaxID=301880 RepID=A0ABQ5E1L3_9ASTR
MSALLLCSGRFLPLFFSADSARISSGLIMLKVKDFVVGVLFITGGELDVSYTDALLVESPSSLWKCVPSNYGFRFCTKLAISEGAREMRGKDLECEERLWRCEDGGIKQVSREMEGGKVGREMRVRDRWCNDEITVFVEVVPSKLWFWVLHEIRIVRVRERWWKGWKGRGGRCEDGV